MDHSETVKSLHKSLRQQVKQGEDPLIAWNNLLTNKSLLRAYAKSMKALAKDDWEKNCSENRIQWCRNVCISYFFNGGLEKLVRKCYKQQLFQQLKYSGIEENDKERQKIHDMVCKLQVTRNTIVKEKLFLLDVGSCFNPFSQFEEFSPIAIDISPAAEDVIFCDFLNINYNPSLKIVPSKDNSFQTIKSEIRTHMEHNELVTSVFDVVVFSLLLSYFPTAEQRLQCCINAHKALQLHGLLVIITPDSSHQNRHSEMMKSWKHALEALGFTRYKYEKLQHLHCMAYQKSSIVTEHVEDVSNHMYIPQDFQELEEPNSSTTINEVKEPNGVPFFSEIDL